MADAADKADAGKKKGPIVLIIIIVLLVAASIGGTLFFTGALSGGGAENADESQAEPVEVSQVAIYHHFSEPFTVNFETKAGLRFLQIEMEAMSYSQAAVDSLITHMPVIRNNTILLLSNQNYTDLVSRTGKDALRTQVRETIQKVLIERTGVPGIEEVFFTSFVIQ